MQWNTGRSYKLDRARHNKSEEYEVPVNKRKRRFKSGGTLVDDKKAMVLSQIKEVHHHADELAKVLANMDTVDAWVVGKMERATTDLSDITHYLDGTTEYADGGMMADGGINNEYFSKQASMKGGIDYYSVDIDTEDGDEIRDLEFKSYSAAKKAYDKYKKSMKYNGETIEDIQLICNYKNGDYDSIGYVGKYNEMTEGQSILLKSIPNPIYERFYNKEVVIEELNGNKITKAFVRNTGEKVPFVIDLNTFKVEKYASGGEVKSKIKKYQILSPDGITIEREVPYYTSKNKAMNAFDKWKENYSRQGYYSSVRYGRIDLLDLEDYCQFITL